jgi:hypothetical protein
VKAKCAAHQHNPTTQQLAQLSKQPDKIQSETEEAFQQGQVGMGCNNSTADTDHDTCKHCCEQTLCRDFVCALVCDQLVLYHVLLLLAAAAWLGGQGR